MKSATLLNILAGAAVTAAKPCAKLAPFPEKGHGDFHTTKLEDAIAKAANDPGFHEFITDLTKTIDFKVGSSYKLTPEGSLAETTKNESTTDGSLIIVNDGNGKKPSLVINHGGNNLNLTLGVPLLNTTLDVNLPLPNLSLPPLLGGGKGGYPTDAPYPTQGGPSNGTVPSITASNSASTTAGSLPSGSASGSASAATSTTAGSSAGSSATSAGASSTASSGASSSGASSTASGASSTASGASSTSSGASSTSSGASSSSVSSASASVTASASSTGSSTVSSTVSSTASSTSASASATAGCANPETLVEWRNMADADKKSYVQAVRCLMDKPATGLTGGNAQNRYEELVWAHQTQSSNIHMSAIFLPWHRYYTNTFHRLLREECSYTAPMPWWDESKDAGNFAASGLFTNDYFGAMPQVTRVGMGECITDGAFAGKQLHIGPQTAYTTHCLARGEVTSDTKNVNKAYVGTCTSRTQYEDMRECIEGGPHAYGHNGAGPIMADAIASPSDPLFFMHHTFIDWMYKSWQTKSAARSAVASVSGTALTATTTLSTRGVLADVQVEDILDTEGGYLCYKYDY